MTNTYDEKPETQGVDRKTLGSRLREAREYLGFSQEQVATHLGIARSALSNIESGQRKVDALELTKLAVLYRRPMSFFTGENEPQELPLPEDVAHLARKAAKLSPDDRAELGRFAEFLRTKNSAEES